MKWLSEGDRIPPGLRAAPRNLAELLAARTEEKPGHEVYRYLRGGEVEEGPWTRAEIQRRARGVAVQLRSGEGVAAGSRALLLFPAGLDFLSAFFGCLHAGVIAVPAPPPDPARLARTLPRLLAIVRDARPEVALADSVTLAAVHAMAARAPELAALRWVAVDGDRFDSLAGDWEEGWAAGAGFDTLAYLQYTSGSTSSPKGVMVSHGNVLYQAECLRRAKGYSPESRSVMWVPNFHDDGLVQAILEPLHAGGELVLLSPLDVVQQPLRWLRAMTRYRGTHGGGPNFMYELCVRRVAPEQREGLDLSSWEVAYNGAEPIREETRARFLAAYSPCGFRASALWSAYGMAESTLLLTGGGGPQGAPVFQADRAALERTHRAVVAGPGADTRPVVSCGSVAPGIEVVVVHPEKLVRCAPGEVGEIWTASPCNALGYWEKPEETEATFGARLTDDPEAGPYLRTGDLGFFHDGELYVTGRYKDLIIVGGRNLYPQDVEQTAEKSHPALRPGGVAAFAVDTPDGEALVVVQELDPRRAEGADLGEVLEAVRAAVIEEHEAPVEAVVLIPAGTLPKTSSGKVQRRPCKADFLAGTQETVAVWRRTAAPREPLAPVQTGKSAAEIESWLVERLAAALNVDPREVEVDRPFARHKLDSRVALSLSGELEEWLGVRLSPTVFYEHPTVRELVGLLAAPAPGGGSSPLPQPPPPRGEGLPLPPSSDGAGGGAPIALVGWSCRFPGAPDCDAFRRLLWEGIDAVRELPEERRQLGFLHGLDPDALPPRGGFLDAVDGFDAGFFSISPREAATMDPQQRLLLEVAWEALESAGIAPTSLAGSPAGVFVGISTSDYAHLQVRFGDPSAVEPQMGTGTSHSIAANRISYFLGLRGPSLAVDTACSSSLVAVHLACRSLRSGECRMALAGGVNLILWPRDSVIFTRAGMLAPDGRCKTFDASADGYSRGEGCGVVVLKRLADALADGDPVLAVIRGSAVNQDGFSSGLTAPNGEAQQEVLRAALADAGLAPADVGYVEAHGTGTALGDPIEVRALGAVLGAGRSEGRGDGDRLRLGSVKTNLGHLEAAAGIAGLLKATLILESGEIPPHLHLREVNPHIALDEAGAEVPTRVTPWPVAEGERRRAGVSSFGFGGTNAHVILEQAPALEPAGEEPEPRLFLLSARTPAALRALAGRFAGFLRDSPASLADVCFTAAVGRAAFPYRLAAVVESREELAGKLAVYAEAGEAAGVLAGKAEGRERPWVPPVEGKARDRAVLATLAALWVRGGEVEGRALYAGEARRRVALPTYPFERKGYWLELQGEAPSPTRPRSAGEGAPTQILRSAQDDREADWAVSAGALRGEVTRIPQPTGFEGLLHLQISALRDVAAMQIQFLAGQAQTISISAEPPGTGSLPPGREAVGSGGRLGGGAVRASETAGTRWDRADPPPGLPPYPPSLPPRGEEPAALSGLTNSVPGAPFDLPLSEGQADLYTVAQVSSEAARAYNETSVLDLRGPLDLKALRQALQSLADRHESLRTVIRGDFQRVLPAVPVIVPLLDLSGLPPSRREEAVEIWLEGESRRAFDLARGPLLRATVVRLDRRSHRLLTSAHHLVADGFSLAGPFLRELLTSYESLRGGTRPRLGRAFQYREYMAWVAEEEQQAAIAAAEPYWLQRFADALPVFEPPADRPRPAVRSFRGARIRRAWEPGLRGAVQALGRRNGATLFVTLFAAYAALLHRWTGQDDLVVGVPTAHRPPEERGGDRLIGHCVDMVAIRSRPEEGLSFLDLLRATRRASLDAQEHAAFPLSRLLRALNPPRDPSRAPIVNAAFNLDQEPALGRAGGLELGWRSPVVRYVKSEVVLNAMESGGALLLDIEYSTPLFDRATMERFHGHLRNLMDAAVASPDLPWTELPLLGDEERRQLLAWSRTAPAPRAEQGEATIHGLVAEQAALRPDAVAVVDGEESWTYAELNRRAARLAGRLRAAGVGPEVPVAIYLERSAGLIEALLAVLQAGGAYVALDLGDPAERLAFLLADSGARVVLTRESLAPRLPEGGPAARLFLEGRGGELSEAGASSTADNAAYLVYTSGSTGRPKGVMAVHRGVVRLVQDPAFHRFEPGDTWLPIAPVSFDASTLEIWGCLTNGGRLVVAPPRQLLPEDISALVERHGVTVLHLTTALFAPMVEMGLESGLPGLGSVRQLLVGGDVMPPGTARRFLAARPDAELTNNYGPTENTTLTTSHRLRLPLPDDDRPVPIGRPLQGTGVYVVDSAFQPVPAGVAGELVTGGAGLARGYHRRPDLTAERFVPHPFSDRPGERLYRTGDRATFRADGTLSFFGRADHQVKIRGFRVEPAEVETALLGHPQVKEAAVVARRGAESLTGFVVPRAGSPLEGTELRAWLAGRLPGYLVPSVLVVLDELPMTPTGKVDRKALSDRSLDVPATEPVPGAEPRTPLEETVAGIWSEILGRERIGVHESFFDLGGHSLLGTRLLSRLRNVFGLELPLSLLFEAPTVQGLADRIEERLRGQAGLEDLPPAPPVQPRRETGPAPLSFAQQRLWFLDRFGPESPVYNLPVAVRLAGPLRVEALTAALEEIARRHEALRTTFTEGEDGPVQRVSPPGPLELPFLDLAAFPAAEAARLEREEGRRPFRLETGPLFRAVLYRLGPEEHTLLLSTHHIVSDGWSFGVLLDELAALYSGSPPPVLPALPALPVQYGDYAAWQNEWLRGDVLERLLAAGKRRLEGHPGAVELPADRPRPALQSYRGRIEPAELPADLAAGLAALARRQGATLFMALLAAFDALLYRYTGSEDLLVGTPVAHRNRAEIEGLIGFFVNTLAVRTRLSGDLPFRELIDRVRAGALAAYAEQDLPFEKLVEALTPERDLSRNPLVQVFFALQNAARTVRELAPGLTATVEDLDTGVAKFDLSLFFQETAEGRLPGGVEYSSDLFDRGTVLRFLGHFRTLLAEAVARPETPVSELPLLSPEETAELRAWSRSAPERRYDATIPELFAAQAAATPDAPAVLFQDGALTYGELDRASARLAARLSCRGVGLDSLVGVCLERSPELIVALLAISRAGGAYLPLDPEHPAERLRFLIEDAGLRLVVTSGPLADRLPGGVPERVLVEETPEREPVAALPAATADSLAYVLYTSGSTGRPKGVAVPHRGVARLVLGADYVRLGPAETVLQFAPVAFDASTLEIWGPLLTGGRVALTPPGKASLGEMAAAVERHGVTTLWLTAAVFQQTVEEHLPRLGSVRQLLAGGDVLPPAAVRRCLEERPGLVFVNGYGPTENTTFTTIHTVASPEGAGGLVPIGRPLAGTDVWIVDRELGLVPAGVPGELVTGGEGLARGYHGRPDLTAERFVPHPFATRPGERLYRTGDRARFRSRGTIEFLGRLDTQVKVRGFRVEPGEVEAALAGLPGVREAAAVVRKEAGGTGDERLVAFVTLEAPGAFSARDLRAALAEVLPPYMVPSEVVPLESLPLTPSGKADRRALAALDLREQGAGRELAAPRNALEEILAGVWAEILRRGAVGIHDDFFDLGGHSLLATRVISRVRRLFGVEVPLADFFRRPTVAALAERIGPERRRSAAGDAIPRVPRDRPLPLSFSQRRLWFFDRFTGSDSGAVLYNVPLRLRLEGPLDAAALSSALAALVDRHESLRTVFAEIGGEPVQRVLPSLPSLPVLDLSALPEPARAREADRLDREDTLRPYDLQTGPLLRAALLRLEDEHHRLFLSLHHIVSDGWSLGILVDELAALYRGEHLAPLPIQYADFAVWQRDRLQGERLDRQLEYWRERLDGAAPSLDLPTDRPRPPVQSFRGADEPVVLPAAVSEPLARAGRSRGATPFMTLLAGFAALLGRYSGQEDFLIGTPVANRTRAEVEGLIGFFVNTLVIRVDLAGDPPFAALVDRVRDAALGAYAHQDLPFERLVEVLAPERDLARAPLFQIVFALQNSAAPGREIAPGLRAAIEGRSTETAKLDFSLSLEEGDRGLEGTAEYATDLFDRDTVRRMLRHFETLLAGAAAGPEARVSELPLLDPAERRQIVVEWNRTRTAAPRDATLPALFAAQVERAPDALAVDASLLPDGESLTYGELDRRARRLARRLRALGVGPEVPVALHLDRSPEMIVALLAVLQAGGAYVPLDPSDPEERLRLLVEDSGAPVRIGRVTSPPWLAADGVLVDGNDPGEGADGAALPEPQGGSLAYVIYTSGSTGRPKGVAVPHRAVPHLALDNGYLPLGPADRVAHLSNTAFDAAVLEVWAALLNGAALVVVPREVALDPRDLSAAIDRLGITVAFVTAAVFHQLAGEMERGGGPRAGSLRLITSGGEAMEPRCARAAWEHRPPGLTLMNVYGPTETTAFLTRYTLGPECGEWPEGMAAAPIGSPIAQSRAHVLDPWGAPVPPGVAGELYLGGDGLARGYWNRPDLTAERFVPDPFAEDFEPGGRLYRTGDRARHRGDGTIEFLGRLDQQVKIRGFRVEPGEIEAVLSAHPAVREAVVLAVPGVGGERRLAACLVVRDGLHVSELRKWLSARLPAWMVPASFVPLDSFPRTASGKVDRRALSRLGASSPEEAESPEAARTPLEEVVAGVWCDALERGRVGVRESFFDLGGHSLLATRLLSRLREVLGVELSLKAFFQEPTVAGQARQAERARRERQGIAAPPLARVPRDRPIRLSFAQERLWLIDQLQPGNAAYNSAFANVLAGRLDIPALERALAEIQRRHEVLRTRFEMVEAAPGLAPEPVQVIAPPTALDGWRLPVVDLAGLPEALAGAEVQRLADDDGRVPFDLARGPLARATLVRRDPERFVLLLTFHHAVCDGWSFTVLTPELGALYRAFVAGEPSPLPELPIQYADYSVWQREWLQGEVIGRQLAFWRRQLLGEGTDERSEPPVLDFPTDRPRPPVPGPEGHGRRVSIPPPLREGLEALARRHGGSLFMTLLAGFQAFLHRHTGQDRIHVGTPVAGRNRVELEPLIGFFVNTLVLPADLAGDPPAGAFLGRVRDVTLGAFDHQDIPFEKLVAAFQRGRDVSRQPLFQAMFVLQSGQVGQPQEVELPGLSLMPLPSRAAAALFDLNLSLGESDGGLVGSLTCRADLFERSTVLRLAGQYVNLLAGMAADPLCPVSELPLLSEAERLQVILEWPDRTEARTRVADLQGRPVPIGAYGVLWEDGRATGVRARYRADGTIQLLEAGGEQLAPAIPAAGAPAARLEERRQQVSSRRSQLSPERRALLDKWVGGKP